MVLTDSTVNHHGRPSRVFSTSPLPAPIRLSSFGAMTAVQVTTLPPPSTMWRSIATPVLHLMALWPATYCLPRSPCHGMPVTWRVLGKSLTAECPRLLSTPPIPSTASPPTLLIILSCVPYAMWMTPAFPSLSLSTLLPPALPPATSLQQAAVLTGLPLTGRRTARLRPGWLNTTLCLFPLHSWVKVWPVKKWCRECLALPLMVLTPLQPTISMSMPTAAATTALPLR